MPQLGVLHRDIECDLGIFPCCFRQVRIGPVPANPKTVDALPRDYEEMEEQSGCRRVRDAHVIESRRLGRVTLEEPIGVGGMAEIWRGVTESGKTVAVKFLRDASADDETARRRFARECAITMDLRHPCAVRGLDQGIDLDGRQFLIVEYVYGPTLDELLLTGPPAPNRSLEIIRDICRTLAHFHARDIFHRDLKPANVMFAQDTDRARPTLIDFGIASAPDFAVLTEDRELLGTVQYMAPEQVYGSPISSLQVDLWGLSALAYETLIGRPAFDAPSLGELCAAIRNAKFKPPSQCNHAFGNNMDAFFRKCFAENIQERFSSVREWFCGFERALTLGSESSPSATNVVRFPRSPEALRVSEPANDVTPRATWSNPCPGRRPKFEKGSAGRRLKRWGITAAVAAVFTVFFNMADLGELAAQWSLVWP